MKTMVLLYATLFAAGSAFAAEDFRVMKLEQDMRNLERHVQTLQRQMSDLQQRSQRSTPTIRFPDPSETRTDDKWLSAAAWQRVKPGMTELQVIEILGTPTALRPDERGRRALLYTLEIGSTGFLTGAIAFENGKAIEVEMPALK